MSDRLKNMAQFVLGVISFTYWCWAAWFSLTIFSTMGSLEWRTFGFIFIPEIAIVLVFFYLMWPGKGSLEVSNKFLSVFSILIVTIFWIISPIQSFFTLNLTGREISFTAFLYLWEVMILGGLFIFILMHWLGRVKSFLGDYNADIKSITKERVESFSQFLSHFPLHVAYLGFFFSLIGYTLSAVQLVFWAGAGYSEGIKSIISGLAFSPLFALLLYVLAYGFLRDIYEILYSFGDIAKPNRVLSIRGKVTILAFSFILIVISLLSTLIWNFLDGNITKNIFLLGAGIITFELIIILYISVKTLVDDITKPLEMLKKGFEILQTGEKRYRINVRTGDEIEELVYGFNKAADALKEREEKR